MTSPAQPAGIRLRVTPMRVGTDSRRGLVRLAPGVLSALGGKAYAVVRIAGARTTAALAAPGATQDPGVLLADDLVLANLGVEAGTDVTVDVVPSLAADRIVLTGPAEITAVLPAATARLALLGKVVTTGDAVSLLQQDLALPDGADDDLLTQGRVQMQTLFGTAWQGVVLHVVQAPPVPTVVTTTTEVCWQGATAPTTYVPQPEPRATTQDGDLPGAEVPARELRELLDVGLKHPELLRRLGTSASLGVLITGPSGCGKATVVRQVAGALDLAVTPVWGPAVAALAPDRAVAQLAALRDAALGPAGERGVLLIDEVEALAPADGDAAVGAVAAATVDLVRAVVAAGRAVVALAASTDAVSHDLLGPGLLSHSLAIGLPDAAARRALLAHLTRPLPLAADVALDDVAARTPGFVAADLAALVAAAGQEAAVREQDSPTDTPQVRAADFAAALGTVHPSSMDGQLLDPGQVGLADIGGLEEVKQVLTESVLWPIAYADTFARLGVAPTRGVLLYGPPGCGKTYLVRALAHDGRANVLAVKGAELLSKWVGESEAGVRRLFAHARGAAPSLVFLDEVDALAPVRGGGGNEVADRVVAALLTELDGIDQLRDVVVVAATNRPDMVDPALLRPGRLERLLYVPPPDAEARAAILRAAASHTPLDADVDLDALAARCEGFSGADCAAVVRQAALAAMHRSMAAATVSAADVAAALTVVRPSLDPVQVEHIQAFAAARAGG